MTTLAVVLGLAIALVLIFKKAPEWFRKMEHNQALKNTVRQADMWGRLFTTNVEHGVFALCRAQDFDEGLRQYNAKVDQGEIKPWQTVMVHAYPTFTFSSTEDTRRPVHTGTQKELGRALRPVIETYLGSNIKLLTDTEYDKVICTIFVKNKSLYVPYSGEMERSEKDFNTYGQTTIEEAVKTIAQTFYAACGTPRK